MGLDMYLHARKFVSGYNHSSDEEKEIFKTITEAVGLQDMHDERYATVSVNVAYWRKANHIHDWFVKHVQGGEDDCKEYFVSRETLMELEQTCRKVVEAGTGEVASELLPTASGFFFGGTDYDEYYFEATDWTAKRLAEILGLPAGMNGFDFYYSSSW